MSGWDDEERAYLVALLRLQPQKLTWPEITERVGTSGSARSVWDEHFPATLLGEFDPKDDVERARASVTEWKSSTQFRFLTFLDDAYPQRLREVPQVPPVLFTAGELRQADTAVSVVGSRKADESSLNFAREVSCLLVQENVTMLAGLASGIDTAAHKAALKAGGRTVAIIGTGIRRQYPAENRDLHFKIAESGLLVSQFWPESPPTRWSFPLRNVTMSAYGYATIVVAAGEHSGTRIQAREAVSHGRPVILTSQVANSTEWGSKLVGQPSVYVASTPDETLEQVQSILVLQEQ